MSANQFHITPENKTSHNMKHVHILKLQNMKLSQNHSLFCVPCQGFEHWDSDLLDMLDI
jgi:hypothetical protein